MKKHLHVTQPFVHIFLCMLFSISAAAQGANRVDIGKSFANMSKLKTGGTFNPGDTVEIRVTFAVIRQTTFTAVDSVQVFDQVPAKTTYISGSMRVATNEGITYRGPFTEAVDTDPGRNVAGNIVINLGNKANGTRGGRIRSDTSRPSFFNSHCIMMAVYRVRINPSANYGDTIKVRGSMRYKMVTPNNGWFTVNFPEYRIVLFPNNGYCPNGADISATSDFSGTFGEGTVPNRAAALSFSTSYIKQNITTGSPNDYYYAIVKNSSPSSSTNPNSPMPESPALHRVFSFWDIGGDHTNATNLAIGNAPPAAAQNGGYFVLINASYNTNVAYQETLTNLCPNTYYEFSAWFRNVCPRCSCDSSGRGSGAFGYIPAPGNDSAGVRPNLNFEIDGLAYYTTGDMKYDRVTPWKKFGFTFLTRPGQTTANFAIRNNSPGGGGNDWAIDDIKVSHCGPNLKMNFAPEVLGCKEAAFPVSLSDTVRSVYNSYIHFKWQKSNVGGIIWNDMTGPGTSGIGSPLFVNGMWEYVTNLPTFMANAADSGIYFRVLVATTAANLQNDCAYKDQSTTMIRAITCGIILQGDFTQFRGTLVGKQAYLSWTTAEEQQLAFYEIEKSRDGILFYPMAQLMAKNTPTASYNFTDPEPLNGKAFYRLRMIQLDGKFKFSQIIQLNSKSLFEVSNIENPFGNNLHINIELPEQGPVNIILNNDKGQRVKSFTQTLAKGKSKIAVPELNYLSSGIYFISVEFKHEIHRRKLVKQ